MQNQVTKVQPTFENGNDVKPFVSGSFSKCPDVTLN